jgi:hypothetical protein
MDWPRRSIKTAKNETGAEDRRRRDQAYGKPGKPGKPGKHGGQIAGMSSGLGITITPKLMKISG